jgi:hypothetical protein
LQKEISELGGRRRISVPQGQRSEFRLTGDQLGRLRAELESQRNEVDAHPDRLKGYVEVQSDGYGVPPAGSKKWLRWFHHPETAEWPNSQHPTKAQMKAALTEHGVGYPDDATKSDLKELAAENTPAPRP